MNEEGSIRSRTNKNNKEVEEQKRITSKDNEVEE